MGGSRVLVVEDDPRLASPLDRVLAAEGHDVEVATDGNDALHRARERPFDLVVLDIMLPGLDGISVCRRFRSTRSVPILLPTAPGGTQERGRGPDSRAGDYLLQPLPYQGVLAGRACRTRSAAPATRCTNSVPARQARTLRRRRGRHRAAGVRCPSLPASLARRGDQSGRRTAHTGSRRGGIVVDRYSATGADCAL